VPSSIDLQPEVVGLLTPDQAAAYSRPFRHDWSYIHARGLAVGAEGIRLFDPNVDDNIFGLPRGYEQFLPAVILAVEHERSVRGSLLVRDALLTVRQWPVAAGYSQHGSEATELHRDISGSDGSGRFYTTSDRYPTQYFPKIDSTPETPDTIYINDKGELDRVDPLPYQVVHASAMTYHRSQIIPEGGVKTFLRLAFEYEPFVS
jgi:hypothetical protein